MQVIRGFMLMAIVVVFFAEGARAQAQRPSPNLGEQSFVEFEGRRWRTNLVSELRFSTPAVSGTDLDPVLELGFPSERTWDYHFGVRLTRRLRLRGNWFRLRYESDTITSGDLRISGELFRRGTTLTTLMELEMRRGGAEFDLLRGDYGFVAVAGEWARFQAVNEITSAAAVADLPELRMSLPLFGLKTRIYLTPALAVSAEALGMKRETIGVMTDVDVSATYNAIPNLAVSYGYRNSYNRFKEIEPGSRAIYRLEGQYFGLTVRF